MQADDEIIYEILETTARTEERTRNIEEDVCDLKEKSRKESEEVDKRLDDLEIRVHRHSMILSGGLATLGALSSAFFGKLMGLIKL